MNAHISSFPIIDAQAGEKVATELGPQLCEKDSVGDDQLCCKVLSAANENHAPSERDAESEFFSVR